MVLTNRVVKISANVEFTVPVENSNHCANGYTRGKYWDSLFINQKN